MTFWDQGDTKGTIKTKKFKIDNIQRERGFIYILGNPGPYIVRHAYFPQKPVVKWLTVTIR